MIQRIDVHSHLLPGVDDGCRDVAESVACARLMVDAGYTHSYCTPHIWRHLNNGRKTIPPAWRPCRRNSTARGCPSSCCRAAKCI
jgi:hypothetical protein